MNHRPHSPHRRPRALIAAALIAAVAGAAAPAGAQAPGQPSPATLPTTPGMRVGSAQVPVVGGNSAGARERALDEALRQTVDLALSDIVDAPTRAAQAKPIRALMARARGYVKRYRTLEEGESGAAYVMRVEAEVDEIALRRAAEKWSATAPVLATAPAARPAALSLLVVTSGVPEAGPALVAALGAVGIAAREGDATLTDPPRALAAAARAGLGGVAFLSASLTDEGTVRGPGKEAVACHLGARVLAAPGGQAIAESDAAPRAFADRPAAARSECLARGVSELAGRLVPIAASGASGGAELRAVTVDAAISEPAALPALLKALRSLGAVSAAELRRLGGGHAELKVETRLSGAALAAALAREGANTVEVLNVDAGADSVRLEARVRPTLAPSTSAVPAPAAAA